MIHFCTLFDSNYMDRGLALYKSLERVSNDFALYVMAFDKESYNILTALEFPHLIVESLNNFETPELLAVKDGRTKGEYCWTCGPSVILYFMMKYNLPSCTYIDADMMFFSNPQIIFEEIGDNDIAISEHFIDYDTAGRFCVQFNYFKNSPQGLEALVWWKQECIKWCFNRYEDGKYGDQAYIEMFPIKFKNVHIITNRGAGVASWNMNQYRFNLYRNSLFYKEREYPIVFFHYHGVKINLSNNILVLNTKEFDIVGKEQFYLYLIYLHLLQELYNFTLEKKVLAVRIQKRNCLKKMNFWIRAQLRDSRFVRFIYYELLGLKNS